MCLLDADQLLDLPTGELLVLDVDDPDVPVRARIQNS